MTNRLNELFSTYSIVARDAATGQIGVAVETHQMCVGIAVPWLMPGVGAVATQSLVNFTFGPMGLAMLAQGVPAPQVLDGLIGSDPGANRRQVAVIDAHGRAAAWTGDGCIAEAGHYVGEGYSVQANMMTRDTVIEAMRSGYENATGDLAARMMAALEAAQREDGDIRGMQSAALVVVSGDKGANARDQYVYNLRVDEHPDPITELGRLVRLASAHYLDQQGYAALGRGERDKALDLWGQARERAPELEELAYWQAVALADLPGDVAGAVTILRPVLSKDARRDHWIDLLRRLQESKLIAREGAAEELIAALNI